MATDSSNEAKARAEARFQAATKKREEADQVMTEHRAEQQRVLDKTAKLKAARLAKEAADAEPPPAPRKRK